MKNAQTIGGQITTNGIKMRLAAIYNVWDDWDLLKYSVANIEPLVDGIIIVASEKSNYGEVSPIPEEWRDKVVIREPVFHQAMHSETDKRNFGLNLARRAGYTHFITMDADEFYDQLEFEDAKLLFRDTDLSGLVCFCQTYFKSPFLTIGRDTTLVPFIHKITPNIKHEFNREYPYAWSLTKEIRIDPTRSLNINSGVKLWDITMHHMSWIRKDFEKKIRNSTARHNLERSTIREDLRLAKEGYFVKFYGKSLVRAQVDFNIPEFNVSDH